MRRVGTFVNNEEYEEALRVATMWLQYSDADDFDIDYFFDFWRELREERAGQKRYWTARHTQITRAILAKNVQRRNHYRCKKIMQDRHARLNYLGRQR